MEPSGPCTIRKLAVDPMVRALFDGGSIAGQACGVSISVPNPVRTAGVADKNIDPSSFISSEWRT